MVTMIQDMQKKIDEMYADWKAIGFGGHTKDDTKWIEVSGVKYYYFNLPIKTLTCL